MKTVFILLLLLAGVWACAWFLHLYHTEWFAVPGVLSIAFASWAAAAAVDARFE